jgi:hypothetical protein
MFTKIGYDVFHIAKRLKSINPKYETFRNMATNKVEVHTSPRPCAWSLAFIVPYDELDERTLEYANRTRIENIDAIEHEQAAANAELAASARKSARQSTAILGDMMNYAANQVHEVIFTKNKRWF